jgi:hypothetical protein
MLPLPVESNPNCHILRCNTILFLHVWLVIEVASSLQVFGQNFCVWDARTNAWSSWPSVVTLILTKFRIFQRIWGKPRLTDGQTSNQTGITNIVSAFLQICVEDASENRNDTWGHFKKLRNTWQHPSWKTALCQLSAITYSVCSYEPWTTRNKFNVST